MKIFLLSIMVLSQLALSQPGFHSEIPAWQNGGIFEVGNGNWNWGSDPLGPVVGGNEFITGLPVDQADIPGMQTPLQAQSLYNYHTGPMPPIAFGGFNHFSPFDKTNLKSGSGIFDIQTAFVRVPSDLLIL